MRKAASEAASASAAQALCRHVGMAQDPTKTCFGAEADRPQRGEDREQLAVLATNSHLPGAEARSPTSQRVLKDWTSP